MGGEAKWRRAASADLAAIMAIQDEVHTLLPERPEIFAEKMRLFNDGCLVLVDRGECLGYGMAYPWMLDDIPPLDAFLTEIPPNADCLFIHDVAILPAARGRKAGKAFVARMAALAGAMNLPALALVSVYGTTGIWARCGFLEKPVVFAADKLERYGESARYMTMMPCAPSPACGRRWPAEPDG